MTDHSRFSPSSANRWMVCQQSLIPIPDEYKIPRDDTAFSRDGSAKHALAEWALTNGCDTTEALLMEMAFAGLTVTTDMVEAADVYVNAVQSITSRYPHAHVEFESRVHMPDIHDDIYGTLDCSIFVENEYHLFIVDAKFGWGEVEAAGNWQLRSYAIGRIRELEDQGYEIRDVTLAIVQPLDTHEPVKIDKLPRAAFKGFVRDMGKAMGGNAIKAGDHCKYCPRAQVPGLCPELERVATAVVMEAVRSTEAGDVDRHVAHYTPDRLAELLEAQDVVSIFFAAVANWTKQTITLGGVVPGWCVKDSEGNRQYRDVNDAERVLLSKFGDGIYEPKQLRSPAQIEKVWPAAKAVMPSLTIRPAGGLKLKRER